eukprot:scaffold176144_cov30-Tisochrysis_lutea.AAC.2
MHGPCCTMVPARVVYADLTRLLLVVPRFSCAGPLPRRPARCAAGRRQPQLAEVECLKSIRKPWRLGAVRCDAARTGP